MLICEGLWVIRTARILQYKKLMRTSRGALHTDNVFLAMNSRRDRVISANEPKRKVMVAKARPIMVRYWKCHPYASFLAYVLGNGAHTAAYCSAYARFG